MTTVGRLVERRKDGPNRLPNFDIPAYDGIGANEFIMNVTQLRLRWKSRPCCGFYFDDEHTCRGMEYVFPRVEHGF